jgi:hypothetical protein
MGQKVKEGLVRQGPKAKATVVADLDGPHWLKPARTLKDDLARVKKQRADREAEEKGSATS